MIGEILGGLGAVAGLLGSGGSDTVTQQTELPDFLKPFAPIYAQAGYNLYNQPFNPYPYETVAPFTQDQMAAMDMVRNQATGAQNPLYGASQQQLMDTIGGQYLQQDNPYLQQMQATMRGDYLNPQTNPYLQQMFDTAADRVTDAFARGTAAQTDARFARAGAFGGSAWNEIQGANQQALGDALAGMGANLYGGNYANERGLQQAAQQFGAGLSSTDLARERALQQQATQFAPTLAGTISSQGYRDADALLNTGGMQQNLGQQYLTDDLSRFTQAQQYPYQQFQQFGQMFNPNLGMNSTQTMPGVSPLSGALGGAMGGLSMYNMGRQAGVWGGGGGGLLGSATASTPSYQPGQLGSGTYGIWG